MKKRTTKEEIEKGDYGLPTRKVFLFCWTSTKRYRYHLADESQTR